MDLNWNTEGVHGQKSVYPLHTADIKKIISKGHQLNVQKLYTIYLFIT